MSANCCGPTASTPEGYGRVLWIAHAEVMGVTGLVALAANFGVAALLYRYREGDSDMRSVWLCTRNDVLGACSAR